MPRPIMREKPMTRINVMLDREALDKAQRKAAKDGIDPGIAGNTSAFIRWLIDEYKKEGDIVIDGKEYYSPTMACKRFAISKITLDYWANMTIKGDLDMPAVFRPTIRKQKEGIPFRHKSPDYYLPCEEFEKWLSKPR
ncbi:MAG: hypothetical protein IKS96_07360 [Fibrobacter sp.]|nr:hypothetical protein [Fibrobacter sp.]MBR6449746.1 hypothetical protein [Fibrobacter sp.]